MPYIIRKANIQDLDSVYLVKQECTSNMDSKSIYQWDEIYPSKNIFNDDILSGKAYVMLLNNIIIGFVTINNQQDDEYKQVNWQYNSDSIGVIHRFMIAPSAQGCGYAKILLEFAENTAKESGYNVIRLDAFKNNPRALRLYEKNGYKYAGNVKFRVGKFNCYEKRI